MGVQIYSVLLIVIDVVILLVKFNIIALKGLYEKIVPPQLKDISTDTVLVSILEFAREKLEVFLQKKFIINNFEKWLICHKFSW